MGRVLCTLLVVLVLSLGSSAQAIDLLRDIGKEGGARVIPPQVPCASPVWNAHPPIVQGSFTQNLGQKGEGAGRFYCQGRGLSIALGPGWASYLLTDTEGNRGHLVVAWMVGSRMVEPVGVGPSDHQSNFFLGDDPDGWVVGAHSFMEVLYKGIYDGIDLRFSLCDGQLKYEYTVQPGADPASILLRYEGADRLSVERGTGRLAIGTTVGTLFDDAPVSYQSTSSGMTSVRTSFCQVDGSTIGFRVADYDRTVALVIDPTVHFSTLVSGSGADLSNALRKVGEDFLICGQTQSSDFPTTPGANDTTYNSTDGFVLKLNHNGSKLLFSTFIGGTGTESCTDVEVDAQGCIYLIGRTTSTDFPTTAGTLYPDARGGTGDGFVVRMDQDASDLLLGTYLGGNGVDAPCYLALDDGGVLTVAGETESTNMPKVAGAYDDTANGGLDVFIARLDSTLSTMLDFTYLGGSQDDNLPVMSISVDGSVYICAQSKSNDFPVSGSAYQDERKGDCDITVSKLDTELGTLVYSTYIGGAEYDYANSFEVLSNGSVLLCGNSVSDDYPLTSDCYHSSRKGNRAGIITMLGKDGDRLEYSTFFGGESDWNLDVCWFAHREADGTLFLIISTYSDDLPAPNTYYSGGTDLYLCLVDIEEKEILAGTFFGGTSTDRAMDYIKEGDEVTMTGIASLDFPTTANAYCRASNGGDDVFLLKSTIDPIAGTVPSAPLGLKANAHDWLVNLTWSPPSDLGGVILREYRLLNGDSPTNLTHRVATLAPGVLSYDDRNVFNGRTYYYGLIAYNWWGEGPMSAVATATPMGRPNPPLNLTATGMFGAIRLGWDSPNYTGGSPIIGYRLHRGLDEEDLRPLADLGLDREYMDSPLQKGTRQYYRVVAYNVVGNGSFSDVVSAVPTGTPGEPTGFRLTFGDGQCLVEWKAPIDTGSVPLLGFKLYRGPSEQGLTELRTFPLATLSYRDTEVTNGQTYFYAMRAFNENGESPLTELLSGMPAGLPGPARDLIVSSGNGTAVLSWTAPTSDGGIPIVGYHVFKGLAEDMMAWYADVDGLTFTDLGLPVGTTFYYKVQAYNRIGDGPMTECRSILVLALPGAPRDVRASAEVDKVTVLWFQPLESGGSPVREYRLYRGTSPTDLIAVRSFPSYTTSYTDTDIASGVTYYYAVAAITEAGEGERSRPVSATPYGLPGPPRGLNATGGDREVALSWEGPALDGGTPVTGYIVLRGPSQADLKEIVRVGVVLAYTDTNVTNGQTYFYAVVALNSAGMGIATSPVEATPRRPAVEPGAVLTLVSEVKDGKVTLVWMAPDDDGGSPVTGYVVLRGLSRKALTVVETLGTVTSWTDTTAEPGKTYYYSVAPLNAVGRGADFAPVEVKVPKKGGDGPGPGTVAVAIAMLSAAMAACSKRRWREG